MTIIFTDKNVHIHIADLGIARLVYQAMPYSDHLTIEYVYYILVVSTCLQIRFIVKICNALNMYVRLR